MKGHIFGSLILLSVLVVDGQAQVKSQPFIRGAAEKVLAADPFDLETGIYFRTYIDLLVQDSIPIEFVRTQRNQDAQERSFGVGSSTSYDMFIIGDVSKFSWVALVMADGSQQRFDRISAGTGYADGIFENKTSPTEFYGGRISWNGKGGWTVKRRDGIEYTIQGCSPSSKRPGQCAVTEIRNQKGERLTVERDRDGNLLEIKSPHDRKVSIMNDPRGRIIRAADDKGHWIIYSYDLRGCLIKTMNWRGDSQWFTYDDNLNIATVRESGPGDSKNAPYAFSVVNHYDERNRLKSQEVSNGDTFEAKYTERSNGTVSRTEVRERHGVYTCDFNDAGYVVREVYTTLRNSGWTLDYERDNAVNAVVGTKLVCRYKGKEFLERRLPPEMTGSLGGTGDAHKMYVFALCKRMLTVPQQREFREETDRMAENGHAPGSPRLDASLTIR